MTESDHKNLLEQLNIKKRALQILEEQHAAFGNLYVPVHIVIEIEDARLDITELQEKLRLDRTYGPRPPETLPPGWNITHRRNPNFSGRDTELATLKTALLTGNTAAVTQAIAGLGGVGKTQLAVEYAYREAANFALVWWLKAELETSLRLGLEQLALKLGLVEQQADPQLAIDTALDFLQSKAGRWLLIFDNANNPTEIRDYLPKGGRGQILITSRWQDWRGYAQPLPVPVWEKDQAEEFLLKRTGRKDKDGAAKLAERLGYLPLALEHAGAYLARNQTLTLAAYLAKFDREQQKLALLEKGELATDHHNDTIRTTWALALEKLPPVAADLLILCAYLAPDDIPLSLFQKHPEKLPEALAKVAADEFSLSETIGDLQQYSLVELGKLEKSISVHRLLQMVIRERSQEQETNSQNEEEASTPPSPVPLTPPSFTGKGAGGLGFALRLTNAASPTELWDYRKWPEYAPVLPHALAVVEEAEKRELEPKTTGRLLNQAALYLQGRADYQTALRLYHRAIAIDEKVYGTDHPEVATDYNNLGSLLRAMSDLPSARIYYDKAIVIDEKTLAADDPELATDYNNLGMLLKDMGDLPSARIYFDKALAIWEKALGLEHTQTALGYNNLGLLLKAMGDLPSARIYFDKALAIREKALGKDHPDVAQSYNNLGALYYAEGDYAQAKSHFERALKIYREKLGEEHPSTKNTQRWLEDVERKLKT